MSQAGPDARDHPRLSVPTVAPPAHARIELVGTTEADPIVAAILGTLIGMHDDALPGLSRITEGVGVAG